MDKQKAGGGSLIGVGLIFLILFLLFPIFTWYLMWFAILMMFVFGIIALIAGD